MCPSVGAIADASKIPPITINKIGNVWPIENGPCRNSLNKNSTPSVVITAGPINPRIVQLLHVHRCRTSGCG
jgi:hypothetical protein